MLLRVALVSCDHFDLGRFASDPLTLYLHPNTEFIAQRNSPVSLYY